SASVRALSRREIPCGITARAPPNDPSRSRSTLHPAPLLNRTRDACATRVPTRRTPGRSHRELQRDALVCPLRLCLSNEREPKNASHQPVRTTNALGPRTSVVPFGTMVLPIGPTRTREYGADAARSGAGFQLTRRRRVAPGNSALRPSSPDPP